MCIVKNSSRSLVRSNLAQYEYRVSVLVLMEKFSKSLWLIIIYRIDKKK